jgi:hypothetical protein
MLFPHWLKPKSRMNHSVTTPGLHAALALIALIAAFGPASAQESAATLAQEPAATSAQDQETTAPADGDEAANSALDFNSDEAAQALRDALQLEPDFSAAVTKPAHAWNTPGLDWKRTANRDGAAYSVKRTLSGDWTTKFGADMGLHDTARAPGDPDWRPTQAPASNTGAAWANVQVPGVASFDARVGAGDAPTGKFGVSRTLPLGGTTSLTLQDSYAATEMASATPPGLASASATPVWSNERQLKFNILPTGTSFGAGTTTSSLGGSSHNSLSAEQKLFDKFNITTTFNDVGETTRSRSITAGFKTNW